MPRKKKCNPSNQKKSILKGGGGATPSTCLFHQLEEGLVVDILSRLSVKNICTCRCVCKSWLFATHDPHFARLHLSRSLSAAGVSILMKPWLEVYVLHFYHIQQGPGPGHRRSRRRSGGDSVSDLQVERTVFLPRHSYWDQSSMVNSCNGLVCTIVDNRIYIFNPLLGEEIILAPSGTFIAGAALGFIKGTNEYKVLQISRPGSRDLNYEAHIYTIGTDTIGSENWRSLGKTHHGDITLPVNHLIHGVPHWLCCADGRIDCIESFDFESEQFQSIPLPSQDCLKLYSDSGSLSTHSSGFGVLKGCLFLCLYDENCNHHDLWIMKDYGVQESWTKLLVLDISCQHAEPIMFLRDEEILVITGKNTVVCYNTAVKTVKNMVICYNTEGKLVKKAEVISPIPYDPDFQVVSYNPSFVSVHDISNGEESMSDILFRGQSKKFKELFPELSNV